MAVAENNSVSSEEHIEDLRLSASFASIAGKGKRT
jgi:hypothetical protein